MRYCRKCGWDERPISWLRRSTVGRLAERNRWVGFLWAASNTIRVIHCPAAMDLTSVSMGGGDHLPCNGCPTISTASVHNCQAILRPPAVSVISTIDDSYCYIGGAIRAGQTPAPLPSVSLGTKHSLSTLIWSEIDYERFRFYAYEGEAATFPIYNPFCHDRLLTWLELRLQ